MLDQLCFLYGCLCVSLLCHYKRDFAYKACFSYALALYCTTALEELVWLFSSPAYFPHLCMYLNGPFGGICLGGVLRTFMVCVVSHVVVMATVFLFGGKKW